MALKVVAQRGDTVMLADPDSGPGVLLVRPGRDPEMFHRDAAFARGYWRAADGPVPDVAEDVVAELAAFNAGWEQTQRLLSGEETSRSAEPEDEEATRSSLDDGSLRLRGIITEDRRQDVTPGHDNLHHYWTRDPVGLAKWVNNPHPARTLHAHLVEKGISSERAWEMVNVWHKEVFGIYPGEKKGKNPLGPG